MTHSKNIKIEAEKKKNKLTNKNRVIMFKNDKFHCNYFT